VTPWEEATPLENWITPVEIERTGNRDFRWVNHVSRRLAEILTSRNLPTLVFVLHNRHHAFSIANDYSVELDERPALSQSEEDRLVLAEYELGASSMIRELITTKHSTVHTATMLNCEREASESAFRRGSAVLMTATGTLSQGLNLPAKAVVICGTKLSEFSDEDEQDPTELRRRSLNQVLNAAGRAARAGVTCRGLSIIVPDDLNMIDDIDKDSPKQAFFGSIEALALKDASLSVDSQLFELLNSVQLAIDDSEATSQERVLLSKFPVDSEGLNQTVQSTLGLYELGDDNAGDRIINRLEKVKSNAIASGIDDWILRAASLAAIDFSLAGNLRDYINNQSQRHDSVMPDDTYVGWAVFLVNWLQTLPAPDIWELLRFHIKSWRYYWGKRSDPDLLDLLATEGYPLYVTENARTALEPIWKNALDTVRAWLDDQTYLALGETLTRRSCPPKRRSSRTSPGHHLVRALTWNQRFIERLSRYAGLLLAIQNQWLEHDPETIPTWLAETETLHTFPLGLRHGVANPSALAWHRYAIQERRAANLLDSLVPIPGRQLTSIQDAWPLVREARTVILESDLEDRETDTLQVIRRLISESE
jgi:hypothetical protein